MWTIKKISSLTIHGGGVIFKKIIDVFSTQWSNASHTSDANRYWMTESFLGVQPIGDCIIAWYITQQTNLTPSGY